MGVGDAVAGVDGWSDRVHVVRSDDPRLPADAVLVRPDGYVAWAGDDPAAALAAWCGRDRYQRVTTYP